MWRDRASRRKSSPYANLPARNFIKFLMDHISVSRSLTRDNLSHFHISHFYIIIASCDTVTSSLQCKFKRRQKASLNEYIAVSTDNHAKAEIYIIICEFFVGELKDRII